MSSISHYQDLAIHTFTTKPWSLSECIEGYAKRGIGGISIWRETLEGEDLCVASKHLRDSGLTGISLVRGGFFTAKTAADRAKALEENRQALKEAELLELPSLVLVCGATPGQTPEENYAQIRDGIGAIADHAQSLGVRLLVEPLHPLYAGDRSGIPSLQVANKLCAELNHSNVGIALDVYHVWWELDLAEQIEQAAQNGWLDTYHICDFKPDQSDLLLDRGIMGEGVIRLDHIDQLMSQAGFDGLREVEIFSSKYWNQDQDDYLDQILHAYDTIYS